MTRATLGLTLLACGLLVGCDQEASRVVQLQQQLADCRERADDLQRRLSQSRSELDRARGQIRTLQDLGDARLEQLFHVDAIHLGNYSTGYDADDDGVDEAIRVYLRPTDRRGDTIKAAGRVTLRVFDLADSQDVRLAEKTWEPEQLDQLWITGLTSHHYRFEFPLPDGPPEHTEITVRAEFVDYLTGRTFTAQTVVPFAVSQP